VHCSGSSPTIRGCVISHNVAYQGGGIASWSCSPCVVDCTIIGNTAATFGGGFYCYQSSPIIDHCLIASNSAPNDGGGLNLSGCHAAIVNCVMPGNRSSGNEGGAIHSQGGNVSISDCLITNNFAWSAGGGLAGSGIDPAIALTGGLTCLLPGSGGLALRSQIDHVARTAYGSTEGANAVIAMFELRLCSAESLEWAPCVNPRYAADRTVPSTR
jgi:predicted outer membrane repeat protein